MNLHLLRCHTARGLLTLADRITPTPTATQTLRPVTLPATTQPWAAEVETYVAETASNAWDAELVGRETAGWAALLAELEDL